jgi:hypothetical protein
MYLRTQILPTQGYYNYHGVRIYELTERMFFTEILPWLALHVGQTNSDYYLVGQNIIWFKQQKHQLQFLLTFG